MQKITFLGCIALPLLVLASCTAPSNPTTSQTGTTTHTGTSYPTTQQNTPATQYCEQQGGVVSVENNGTMDVAYCTLNGVKKDAWEMLTESQTGSGDVTEGTGDTQTMNTTTHYTLDQVATHNSRSDCWTVVNGVVYDLSSFFGSHPGGADNLARLCGIDGTEAFTNQHGSNREAQDRIRDFEIGTLVL